jgi:hypothetical protein
MSSISFPSGSRVHACRLPSRPTMGSRSMGAVLAQMFDDRVQVVGQQADVPEALFSVRVGGWSAGEDLEKAVARDVKVHEHERAVVIVQAESLLDAEHPVEVEGPVYIVRREGGMSEVGDHGSSPLVDDRRA